MECYSGAVRARPIKVSRTIASQNCMASFSHLSAFVAWISSLVGSRSAYATRSRSPLNIVSEIVTVKAGRALI
jgi:hypothetical protein